MHPQIFGFIKSFGLLLAVSFLVGAWLSVRRGRARGEVTWVRPLSSEGVDVANRFRTREVDQLEWRGALDLSLSDHVNAVISYSGRTLESLPTTHLARAEVRALF